MCLRVVGRDNAWERDVPPACEAACFRDATKHSGGKHTAEAICNCVSAIHKGDSGCNLTGFVPGTDEKAE